MAYKRKLKKKLIKTYKVKVIAQDMHGKTYCLLPANNTIKHKLFERHDLCDIRPGEIFTVSPRRL